MLYTVLCRSGSLDSEDRDYVAKRCVRIVEALHSKSIAWLDVKPGNFILVGRKYVGIDLTSAARLHSAISTMTPVSHSFASTALSVCDKNPNCAVPAMQNIMRR